ncbi:MAG: hypothetical protein CL946_03995 [Ectothiorhodospiraceae bacterium]|nr:hypothetical protein [Ectothiorhodospiraceae bacterium]
MYHAISEGDCEKIDELVSAGVDVNETSTGDEWNFLHMALVSQSLPPNLVAVRHLIDIGVDINAKDRFDWTPLHFAVRSGSAEAVKMLVDAGANVSTGNIDEVTPLHLSILQKPADLEIVEMLLAAGADPNAVTSRGSLRRYLGVAVRPDKDEITALLDRYSLGR